MITEIRRTDYIREYDDGSITIQLDDPDVIEQMERDEMLIFSDVLSWADCYIAGEQFCLSNYEMGCAIYNVYSDVIYIFAFSDLEKLKAGEPVTLAPIQADEEIRNGILEECGF